MDKKHILLKKVLVIGIIVLFISVSVIPITGSLLIKKQILINNEIPNISGNTRGNIYYVGGTGPNNYTKIQDPINDANDGDTIFIYNDSSPYYENVYVDYKENINLIGEDTNTTIVDAAGGEWGIVSSHAHGLTVRNLTIQNVTTSYGTNFAFFSQHSDNMKIIKIINLWGYIKWFKLIKIFN